MNHDPALELVLDFLASRRWRGAEEAVRRAALSTEQSTDANGNAAFGRNSQLELLVGGPASTTSFRACGSCGNASQAVASDGGLTYASPRHETQPPSPISFHNPAHDAASDQWDGEDDAGFLRVEASEDAVVRELTRSASDGGAQPPRSSRAGAGVPSREGFETFEQVFGERELEETVGAGVEAWIGQKVESWMGQAGFDEPPSSVEVAPSEGESRDDVDAMEQLSEPTSVSPPTARGRESSSSDEAPAANVGDAPAEAEPMEHASTMAVACEAAACEATAAACGDGVAPEATPAAEAGSQDLRGDGLHTNRRALQAAADVLAEAAADADASAGASADAGDGGAAGSGARVGAVGVAEGGVAEGGVAEGGVAEGGVAEGGVAEGGVAEGGVAEGGVAEGGVAEGGVAEGGVAEGGVAEGGVAEGGVAEGGVAEGGVAEGGVAKGGVAEGVSRLSMSTRDEDDLRTGADAAVAVEGEAAGQQQGAAAETAMEGEVGAGEGAAGSAEAFEGGDDAGREGEGASGAAEEETGAERAGVLLAARASEYEGDFGADAEENDGDGVVSPSRSMRSEKSERSVRLSEASLLMGADDDDDDDDDGDGDDGDDGDDGEEDEEEVLESDPEIDPYERAAAQAAVYETLELKVIHERRRTGFEEYKDFPIRINSVIAARYQVKEYLGSAAFSKAIQCLDLRTGEMVCIKIIKNSKDFFDQSLDEIKLLRCLRAHDPDDKHHVLRMYDSFYHKEHLFIVCELLRDNLYEFSKYNRESGGEAYFTLPRLRAIAKQCLEALVYVHSLGLIHCDLKPENILIKSYSRCEVKVIDFGSSCFSTDHLSSYVQSRSYRAPEVVLGLPYGEKIDVWSLGAILAELLTGKVLFQNDSVATMLARIVSILGPFPSQMLGEGRHVDKYFVGHAVFEVQDDGATQLLQPKATSLRHRLRCDDEGFLSFLGSLLKLDPRERPSARQALTHPWIARDPY